ncbi:hypothetical protein [Anabaena lutea]|uniref:Uncharacterized protein n=1 Tax=Anabaena lutea FACHB-196 TaxID=2692881 RepID=A0ABR8FMF3_9NOST|nr:hypothetical protein [Anabaena lutea]MBD2571348.1 hypothetical protein [Anabaena lutea FACHB-196]
MAVKTDLTWTELQAALTAKGLPNAVVVSGGKVMIDVGVIVGEATEQLTDEGVCETLFKLRDAAGAAQETVNETLLEEERLTSFPGFSFGSPDAEGLVGVTQTSTYTVPLNLNQIFGTN